MWTEEKDTPGRGTRRQGHQDTSRIPRRRRVHVKKWYDEKETPRKWSQESKTPGHVKKWNEAEEMLRSTPSCIGS